MIRPKIDTRPLEVRIRELRTMIAVLGEQRWQAEIELIRLERQSGIVRDQHPVKTSGDGGI